MVWRNIPSYSHSKVKSLVKMPKGIFRDSGVSHFIYGLYNFKKLYNSSLVGHSFEAYIIEELIRDFEIVELVDTRYYYFRTKNGPEVDLILEGEFGTLPIRGRIQYFNKPKTTYRLHEFYEETCLRVWFSN